MQREHDCDPAPLPPGLASLIEGRRWARDMVGQTGVAVYRLCAPGRADLYLKHGAGPTADDVADEAARLRWLRGRWPVPVARGFVDLGGECWLLSEAIPGPTAWQVLDARPDAREAVVDALAAFLARLHATPVETCPFEAGHAFRLAQARRRLEAGAIDEDDFGEEHRGWSANRLWHAMTAMLPLPMERVVTHGDFSLDNIVMDGTRVAGCLDVGRVGVADPYQDLAILWSSVREFDPALGDRLFARYGTRPVDERRLGSHLMLDECF